VTGIVCFIVQPSDEYNNFARCPNKG